MRQYETHVLKTLKKAKVLADHVVYSQAKYKRHILNTDKPHHENYRNAMEELGRDLKFSTLEVDELIAA